LLAHAVRSHWGVENRLHWVLDVAFAEDDCPIHSDHAPENLARLRQMALNLLSQETTAKIGVANKRLKASWDNDYLARVLDL
jgi:predicted transposase YbfD/YdcC